MNPSSNFYPDPSDLYYDDSYQEASDMSSNMLGLQYADGLPLINEQLPTFMGYLNQQMEDPFVDHMHSADHYFNPSIPSHLNQTMGDHSQMESQGGASYQGMISYLDPILFAPLSNTIDNTSMSNTFGNHHVGHREIYSHETKVHEGNCTHSSGVDTLFIPSDKIHNNTSISNSVDNNHVGHNQMNVNVAKVHDGDSAKSSSVDRGAPTIPPRGKPFDPDEPLGFERLWNFEAFHTNALPDELPETEPLLTQDEFTAAVRLPYDPLWIDKRGIDRSKLAIPASTLKFEKLFIDSVLMVGDLLVFGDVDEGIEHDLKNSAWVLNASKETNWWPDLQIRAAKEPEGYQVLKRCKGTQQLIKAIHQEDKRMRPLKNGAWKYVYVIRNGINLGCLEKIRDEYAFWVSEVDQWASRNNKRRVARRFRCPSLIWHDKKFYRALPDGSTELMDYEHDPNPVYRHHMGKLRPSNAATED